MGYKNEYLPTKCWFENEQLHRAFFEYEEDIFDSPREWDNMGIIVNASSYNLCGPNDEVCNDIEDWLIHETGINEDWYYNNKKRYGGIDGLINKFIKEKCAAFQFISVYDHSGISVSCGLSYGWDYSQVGFIYVPKDNNEIKTYRKSHSIAETKEYANKIIEGEIQILNDYVQGNVYCCIHEVYDEESGSWSTEDTLGDIYLTSDTRDQEQAYALEYIKEYSREHELYDWKVIEDAIKNNTLDVLQGQRVFEFMEIA